jgi:hypothetical protein
MLTAEAPCRSQPRIRFMVRAKGKGPERPHSDYRTVTCFSEVPASGEKL